jgi:hypothetical protein
MTMLRWSSVIPAPRTILAHALAGGSLLLCVGFVLLLTPAPAEELARTDTATAGGFVLGATFPVVGWIVATKRPANAMGWIFLGVGLSQALDTFALQYATVGLVIVPGALPAADLLAWVASWVWAPGYVLLLTATVLLFPDGRPPSPRWRPVLWAAGLSALLLMVPMALIAWPSRGVALLGPGPGPSDLAGLDPALAAMLEDLGALIPVGLVLLLAAAVGSIAGLVARFRASAGVERTQLKWFVAAGVVEIAVIVISTLEILPWTALSTLLAIAVSPLVPVAATIAILRYRLYEIDRIVSRTVGYLLVSGLLAGTFAILVVTLQALLAPLTESNDLAVAGSTLVVASLFQPLRTRIQRAVDQRFNRTRLSAEGTVRALMSTIRDEVDGAAIVGSLVGSIERTLQPASTSVWIRGGDR